MDYTPEMLAIARGGVPAQVSALKGVVYGKRPDGTYKGSGWFGELKAPSGKAVTEYGSSVTDERGKVHEFPTVNPYLNPSQLARLVNIADAGGRVPDDIMDVSIRWAKRQEAMGESPYKNSNTPRGVMKGMK